MIGQLFYKRLRSPICNIHHHANTIITVFTKKRTNCKYNWKRHAPTTSSIENIFQSHQIFPSTSCAVDFLHRRIFCAPYYYNILFIIIIIISTSNSSSTYCTLAKTAQKIEEFGIILWSREYVYAVTHKGVKGVKGGRRSKTVKWKLHKKIKENGSYSVVQYVY